MNTEVMVAAQGRKPRIALMGEFSAGKSTLCNLLLGQAASPVQITATQLPPVWYRYGSDPASLHFPDGRSEVADAVDLVHLAETGATRISVSLEAPLLEHCDLIDMPGTSDPNMPMENWQALLPEIDMVVWCTPASQAWRQTEAALWEELPEALWSRSILLITRADKLASDRDKARVQMRVSREVEGLFESVMMISLTDALSAQGDPDRLSACGAAALEEKLMQFLGFEVEDKPAIEDQGQGTDPRGQAEQPVTRSEDKVEAEEIADVGRVVPRRVGRVSAGSATRRPAGVRPSAPHPGAGS